MTPRTLIRRSLRYHWRSHLGVVLGAAIGSAALIGALVVGDSVRESLKRQALRRVAGIHVTLESGDRFFGDDLLTRMIKLGAERARNIPVSPTNTTPVWGNGFTEVDSRMALRLPASIARQDGGARLNQAQLFGMTDASLRFLESGTMTFPGDHAPRWPDGKVLLNGELARQLGVSVGDELVLRIPKPSALSHDTAIANRSEATVALRLSVGGIASWPPAGFSPGVSVRPALNAFMRLEALGDAIGREGVANLILPNPASQMRNQDLWFRFKNAYRFSRLKQSPSPFLNFDWLRAKGGAMGIPVGDQATIAAIQPLLRDSFLLRDAEVLLTPQPRAPQLRRSTYLDMRTPRIFLDAAIVRSGFAADSNAQPLLTYLATLLQAGTNATPYSMVTAAGAPWTPKDLRDDEIVVSQWLAEDLRVKPGDEIALSYFLPESGANLVEATNTFRVHSIVPMEMPWADRTLMPDFPGIEKTESTRDWDAGFPLTYKIRDEDEEYWKQHRGTPKAFITLAAGQKMWGNRFGNLTAIRFPIPANPDSVGGGREGSPMPADGTNTVDSTHGVTRPTKAENFRAALEKKILANLKPEELGLRFEPVREQALKAAEQSQDFGGLFLGFSFFLITAALLLMAMLFQFGLEQRAPEIGTLLALGFTPKQVRNLFLREGVALAFIGGVTGVAGGIYYAKAMIQGLNTIWRDAVGATSLNFHITTQTLAIGILASVVVSTITIWLALRKFVKRSPRELLVGETELKESGIWSPKSKVMAVAALLAALGLCGWAVASGDTTNAGIFFGAGALLLVAGLCLANAWLLRLGGASLSPSDRERVTGGQVRGNSVTLGGLAVRGCARRQKRSLTTIAMLACGSFLIVSIGVFRLDANRDATKRESGTGGFALIGETTMPVMQDLNSESGREFFALNERDLADVNFVPFRVRAGDEASCLNLNAAQRPRLLGVKPEILEGRFGFAKGDAWTSLGSSRRQEAQTSHLEISQSLLTSAATNEVPAIGDANSIQWAMHKKVGDTIDYVDERGQPFKVRIVGAVANSILQGQLIIDEAEFVKRFPGESGYRMFLIDAPSNSVSQVSATLSRAMQDVGLELTPTAQRLAQFNAVQNTYLGTFQVLGGLGLLLGSVGLGIVVLRNVLERRAELAVLMAVGFRKTTLQRLLFMENGALLLAGLALGVAAAAMAVLPALISANGELPVVSLGITLGAVLVNGALWTWAATRFAVRGDLLEALRNE